MPPIEPGVSHDLAKWRAARYSEVRYKLDLTLEKISPVLKGTMEIRVNVSPGTSSPGTQAPSPANAGSPGIVILDWRKIRGHEQLSTISNVSINGTPVQSASFSLFSGAEIRAEARTLNFYEHNEHLIFRDGVVPGENLIKLDFTSPILTSGSAITRYVDKEDGTEYIYSLFVPSDASTAFPVFDQPDLKARFTLKLSTPRDWKAVSNSVALSEKWEEHWEFDEKASTKPNEAVLLNWWTIDFSFAETKPISTYVFAFAAGPFERVSEPPALAGGTNAAAKPTLQTTAQRSTDAASIPPAYAGGSDRSSIYVRKSQAAKFKPHAAEVFRLNREGIKYLEQYFDYKFPFPKYDLVLIPEFPFGGMEHAGATFLRESSIIFPQDPTKSDYISRANLIFHEAAHQWFGDTVTMKWFDDLWLKEGFAEFMAYKTLERVMPEANAWKVFYERNKQAAYLTDSTKGTTPIYQEIANLNAAKSAYGNIVYRKAPSFLRQAEFYLGPEKFQTAVRAFLKKHEYANAGWKDLVREFEISTTEKSLGGWAERWVLQRGAPVVRTARYKETSYCLDQYDGLRDGASWPMKIKILQKDLFGEDANYIGDAEFFGVPDSAKPIRTPIDRIFRPREAPVCAYPWSHASVPSFVFPNYQDHGYGIFLLDDKSRDYVLKNIGSEKDDFLRSMMWGSLWDSVREGELDPKEYVELAISNLPTEKDETIVASILGRVATAMNYYLSEPPALGGGTNAPARSTSGVESQRANGSRPSPPANAGGSDMRSRFEAVLLDRLQNAPTPGQRITFHRAFVANASTPKGREVLKQMLTQAGSLRFDMPLRTKDRFDIVQRLVILGDPDALKLLAELEKSETSDDAKRYAYAARAGIATAENKAKYWNDFTNNKDISESWIEAAFGPWNSIRHSDLTLPYLQKALQELPNHKRNRKIFFVNGWLGAFIGGQRSEQALAIVNKFLADNPTLDRDLRLKILENVDLIERAVKIRSKYGKN
jgi:aminopeptidase N